MTCRSRSIAAGIILLLTAHTGLAQADPINPIKLTPDVTTKDKGTFAFTLVAEDGMTLPVAIKDIPIKTSQAAKATLIYDEVKKLMKLDKYKDWDVKRTDNTLTFTHKSKGGDTLPVPTIKGVSDSTGEDTRFTASASGGKFDFGISSTLTAAGKDGSGLPSFASVTTSSGFAEVDPITKGMTAASIVGLLYKDLKDEHVDIRMISTTSFQIIDLTPNAFIQFQVTDINLPVTGASASVIPEPASLTLGSIAAVIGLICWWCRRKQDVA
jgi:hypothetical protein